MVSMKKVLIVDDEERLILTMKAGLEEYKNQFEVVTAFNGKQAVDILKTNEIHLVVTDLKMPEMDGFELLSHLNLNYPLIPYIVMTAFNTPEIEKRVTSESTFQLIEKPINLDELAEAILNGLKRNTKGGTVSGISLSNFLQLIVMEQKTCLLEVLAQNGESGLIYFYQGDLYAAIAGEIKGEEAIYNMLTMEDIEIRFKHLPKKKIKKLIQTPLMQILMEGLRLKDDQDNLPAKDEDELSLWENGEDRPEISPEKGSSETESDDVLPAFVNNVIKKGEEKMGAIEETLEKFKNVDGFMAAGIFSPNGELAAQVNASGVKIEELGALANDVLLKAQKATDLMEVGRGQLVHIEAPKAHIIARCLNEATDFAASSSGRAHIHMVVILSKEGNLAMGKMKASSIIQEVAPAFR